MEKSNNLNKNNLKAFVGGFPKSFFDSFLASKKNRVCFVESLYFTVNNRSLYNLQDIVSKDINTNFNLAFLSSMLLQLHLQVWQ